MLNLSKLHYYGKLRRRREYIKSVDLLDESFIWDTWFNRCSRKNSFLPFLEKRSMSSPVWLFAIDNRVQLKIGLTTMSCDMSDRSYPFIIYCEVKLSELKATHSLKEVVKYFAERFEKFNRMVSIGNLSEQDLNLFVSDENNNSINEELSFCLQNMLESIAIDSEELSEKSSWINMNNLICLNHSGGFTCTLYNRIYG